MRAEKYRKQILDRGQPPVIRAKYPHMLPKDFNTWSMFLERKDLDLDEVWYDVHVGRQMRCPEGSPQYILNVVEAVSRKRIDVVARKGNKYYVIEVKPHANMESLGQIITYRQLLMNEYDIKGHLRAVIVCKTADADIQQMAEQQKVLIVAMKGVLL